MGPYRKLLSLRWSSVCKMSMSDNVELSYNEIADRIIPMNQIYLLEYSKGKFITTWQLFNKTVSRANIMELMKKICKPDGFFCIWRNYNIFYWFISILVTGPLLMLQFIICCHKIVAWVFLFSLVLWVFCTMNFNHIHLLSLDSSQIYSSPIIFPSNILS